MSTPFRAPKVMPHSPDGNLTYDIFKFVIADANLAAGAGLDEDSRVWATQSEEAAHELWNEVLRYAREEGSSLSLASHGLLPNHVVAPDLSQHEGLVPPDPNGTPFFVPTQPVDDLNGGISYDRWKTLIANPETRQMLGLDDKSASWIMRSEEGAYMLYQQGLANEQQAADAERQQAFGQMEAHINEGFKYAGWSIAILVATVVLFFVLF